MEAVHEGHNMFTLFSLRKIKLSFLVFDSGGGVEIEPRALQLLGK
jgi:hypothetical protein